MRRRRLLLALPLLLLTAGGAALIARPSATPTVPPPVPSSIDRVLSLIRDRYLEPVDEGELVRVAAEAMLRHLGDPYAAFLSGPSLLAYRARLTGSARGLGAQVAILEGRVTVTGVVEGGPAAEAGLRAGDRILAIDGHPMDGLDAEGASYLLDESGPDDVSLLVQWGLRTPPESLSVGRRELPSTVVAAAGLLDSATAYVALRGVSDGTRDALVEAVDPLVERGVRTLILDLRGNLGGRFREATRVADLFLPDGTVLARRELRRGEPPEDVTATGPERWPALRLAVLVDANTASAAEVVAGALQVHGRARLFGTPTYGKNAAQELFDVGDGTMLRLTTGRWLLPTGEPLALHQGLRPDQLVPPRPADPDRARWRALLGDRAPRLEGTLRRFAAGWAVSCEAPPPRLREPVTWRTLRRTLVADSLYLPALATRDGRTALERYLGELGVRENCGEAAWRLRAQGSDPVTTAARAWSAGPGLAAVP